MHIHWQWTGKDLKHGELQGELPFCISTVMETNNKQKQTPAFPRDGAVSQVDIFEVVGQNRTSNMELTW
jgi:hypothetical protein